MIINETTKSLEEKIYTLLEEEILTGEYKHGDAITEMSLCKKLNVSRTPVRAALHRLAEDGLIKITPNKGAVVIGVTDSDLIDTYRIRMKLEGLASSIAAEKMPNEDKKKLRDAVELSEFYLGKGDTEKLKELDTEFHQIIYKASGNRLLTKILTELHRNIKAYRKMSLGVPGRLEQSADEHRQILEAIENKDSALAERLTCSHVEKAMNNTITALNLAKEEKK